MRLTVLGACGAWPEPGQACSGYLVEHDGFRLLIDAGYATVPRLLERMAAHELDAVFISHGHPDHCADLNPLLRARALGGTRPRRCRSTRCPARSTPCWRWTTRTCWRAPSRCTSSPWAAAWASARSTP